MRTTVGCALALTMAAAHLMLSSTAQAQPTACASRQSSNGTRIEEAGFVSIGGLEQWVTIRGDDRSNPVLLHVHGGPGVAFSAFSAEFAAYESDFTVVQWDQRGSGCTFGRHGKDTPDLTLERIASDGIELAGYLERHLRNPRIIVLGHSFGSVVAAEMVQRAPERFAAYVGTAQFARFAGPPDPSRMPAVDAAWLGGLQARATEVMALKELADWQQGRGASIARLVSQVTAVDLFATIGRLEVPFIVIQGSADAITPTDLAVELYEHVDAPAKELVIVEGAGHFPHLTHTDEFLAALSRTARPLALR